MDFLKNQFQRIQQQLAGLSASQKMLTGALVAIMVMTLVFWGRNAGNAEMEPLLDQAFKPAEVVNITTQLRGKGIRYEVQGDRVLVQTERKWEALADLAYAKLLPQNTVAGFDEMVDKLKPWAGPTERDALYNRAREGACAQIIGRFPGVEHAVVLITPESRRTIGRPTVGPRVSVDIATIDRAKPDKRLAEAAATTVAGAVVGLTPDNIHIVINGARMRTGGDDGSTFANGGGGDSLEIIQEHERYRADQVRDMLSDIPGVLVTIYAKRNNSDVEQFERAFNKENTLNELEETRTTESESTSGEPAEEEDPGVSANTGLRTNRGGGEGTKTSEKTTEERMKVLPGEKTTKTIVGRGDVTVVSASVRVPRSHFANILKSRNADGKAPDEKTLDAFIGAELPKLKEVVVLAMGLQDDKAVRVDSYADSPPMLLAAAGTPLAASITGPMSITSYGKEIALGGLALVSLFMLMMMVKRSAPAPAIVAAAVSQGTVPQMLSAGEMFAGEAGAGGTMLDGMELDDDTVKTQHMLDQVTTLVKDNPDAAASLVQRWMSRD
jgi:flagellar biosynthesis/type III secretory pathway M-ring protein FliF/YscJ